MKYLMAAIAITTLTAPSVEAQVATRNYQAISNFAQVGQSAITTSFTLTFNEGFDSSQNPVVSNFVSNGGDAFSNALAKYTFSSMIGLGTVTSTPGGGLITLPSVPITTRSVDVFGEMGGVFQRSNDFNFLFQVDGGGNTLGTGTSSYTDSSGKMFQATSTIVTALADPILPSAVPEPASWAMMIFGFGMVGGTMRRRKSAVATRVSYAV